MVITSTTGNRVAAKTARGFESLLLRQLRNSLFGTNPRLAARLLSRTGNFFASNRDPLRWARGWVPPCGRLFHSYQRLHLFYQHKTRRSKLCIACSDLFYKSERAHAAAPPLQTATVSLGCGLGPPLRGGFACHGKNIDFNRPFQKEGHLLSADVLLFGFRRPQGGPIRGAA